ncbi:MAG: EamA family transporter [Caulobacteraceae bacterium]|nr:EamA family transporter [Caulobacteraceae bacterium]
MDRLRDLALPVLAVTAAVACFQFGAALAKGLFPALGAQGAASLRTLFAALLLVAIARPWRVWRPDLPKAPLLGLGVSMAAAVLFFYLAIDRLPLGMAIALQFLGPLAIAIAGSRRPLDLAWAALAAAGVWGLVGGDAGGQADPLGVLYALGAAAGWAGYILCGRIAAGALGAAPTAALALSVAALIILPVGVQHAGAALLNLSLWPLALAVAVFSTALPMSLELFAMPRMPARTFAVFTSLEPAFGVLAGFLALHERMHPAQLAGLAAVVCAAMGSAAFGVARPAAAAPD